MNYEEYLRLVDSNIPDLLSVYKNEIGNLKEHTTTTMVSLSENAEELTDKDTNAKPRDYVWKSSDYAYLKDGTNLGEDPNNYITSTEGTALTAKAAYERYMLGIHKFQTDPELIDITNKLYWRATSHKPGCSIDNVGDDNPATYWQSDGFLPHTITANFSKIVSISTIAMFFSFSIDESYSPYCLKVYAGNSPMDLIAIKNIETENVNGWVSFHFGQGGSAREQLDHSLQCKCLRFVIFSNHQNGKDTHLRGIKLLAKRQSTTPVHSQGSKSIAGTGHPFSEQFLPSSNIGIGIPADSTDWLIR